MIIYVPERTKVCFQFKTCVSLMHTNWHSVGCFFWPRENGQEFSLMSGERSFLNLFHDSRTPLDSTRDKLVSLIYFIFQCPSDGTTWYSASCARNGYCKNLTHCFITKLISDFGHCVLFDIFLFNRFDHVRFFVIRSWFRFKSLNVFRSSELMYEWFLQNKQV